MKTFQALIAMTLLIALASANPIVELMSNPHVFMMSLNQIFVTVYYWIFQYEIQLGCWAVAKWGFASEDQTTYQQLCNDAATAQFYAVFD